MLGSAPWEHLESRRILASKHQTRAAATKKKKSNRLAEYLRTPSYPREPDAKKRGQGHGHGRARARARARSRSWRR